MHDAARKHVGARREICAAWAPHEQQLPCFPAPHEQHGRGGSRRNRRAFEVERARGQERDGDGPSLAVLANYDARMDLGIGGKVALVTAGTKGIGLGIAHALAAEGVRVAVAARAEVDVKRTAQSLGGLGVGADLLPEAGCRRAVSQTEQSLRAGDSLINNLGVRAGSSWADTGP